MAYEGNRIRRFVLLGLVIAGFTILLREVSSSGPNDTAARPERTARVIRSDRATADRRGAEFPFQEVAEVAIDNRLRGLTLINSSTENGLITATVRNDYSKDINGYSISMGVGGKHDVDFTIDERVIKPGGVIQLQEVAPRTNSPSSSAQMRIIVLAVFFTDRSSEGEPSAVRDMEDRRRGIKTQLGRILPLLKTEVDSKTGNLSDAIDRLKTQIAGLSEDDINGGNWTARRGLRSAKEDVLRDLTEVESTLRQRDGASARQLFLEFVQRHEKRLGRL